MKSVFTDSFYEKYIKAYIREACDDKTDVENIYKQIKHMCGEGEAVNNNSIDDIISNVFDQESVLKKKETIVQEQKTIVQETKKQETDEEYQTRVNKLLSQTDSVITENKL